VPVFARQVVAAEGSAFSRTLNAVSAKLTTPAMQRMNAAAEVGKRSPADVARGFLRANGLL
jgi:osmoprotectant transport system substrate-binding protein